MRAHLELSPVEKATFRSLNAEEREAVIDQLLEQAREDLEWVMALENARQENALAAARPSPPPVPAAARISTRTAAANQPIPARRYQWPSSISRARR